MKIHLRYILSSVLVSCHSQSVLIQNKAVLSCCWVLVHLEEINLSWPTKGLKYGVWYYCLSEYRICSNLIELFFGSCRCTTQNKSHLLHCLPHPCWNLRCGPHASLSNGCFYLKSPNRWLRTFPPIRALMDLNIPAQFPLGLPNPAHSPGPCFSRPWGRQSQPQECQSPAPPQPCAG